MVIGVRRKILREIDLPAVEKTVVGSDSDEDCRVAVLSYANDRLMLGLRHRGPPKFAVSAKGYFPDKALRNSALCSKELTALTTPSDKTSS